MIHKRLSTTAKMKSHSLYGMAKSGCIDAARLLVADLFLHYRFNLKGYVCPVQRESGNKIPYAFAEFIALNSKCILYKEIFLVSPKIPNTIANKIFMPAVYSGPVLPGKYIIIDDVFTTGRTLIGLNKHISNTNGIVTHAITIGSSRNKFLLNNKYLVAQLLDKFPYAENYIDVNSLTPFEINYLLKFNSLQSVWQKHADSLFQHMFL